MEDLPIDTGIQIQPINEFKAYSELWDFFYNEHGITLLNSELDEIIYAVESFKKTYDGSK